MAGQTRALLMRNRFLAGVGGVRPTVLALGGAPDYEERRQVLLERGLLSEDVGLLNIYDHYREHGWGDAEPGGEPRPDLGAPVAEETRPDGSPWRTSYREPGTGRVVHEYLRDDGGGKTTRRSKTVVTQTLRGRVYDRDTTAQPVRHKA